MAIMNSAEFARMIEQIAREHKYTHMEAVLKYCEMNYIEPQEIAKMIDGPLKEKIRNDFVNCDMLPKTASFDI